MANLNAKETLNTLRKGVSESWSAKEAMTSGDLIKRAEYQQAKELEWQAMRQQAMRQQAVQHMAAMQNQASGLLQNPYLQSAYQPVQAPRKPPPNPNEIAAYAMKLKDLVIMWELKFQDTWADGAELVEDEFWKRGLTRLRDNELLEEMHGANWYRLKEHD